MRIEDARDLLDPHHGTIDNTHDPSRGHAACAHVHCSALAA